MDRSCQQRRLVNHRLCCDVFEQRRFDVDHVHRSCIDSDLVHRDGSDQRHKLCDPSDFQERSRKQSGVGVFGTCHTSHSAKQSDSRLCHKRQLPNVGVLDRSCQHRRLGDHLLSARAIGLLGFDVDRVLLESPAQRFRTSPRDWAEQRHSVCVQSDCQECHWP